MTRAELRYAGACAVGMLGDLLFLVLLLPALVLLLLLAIARAAAVAAIGGRD